MASLSLSSPIIVGVGEVCHKAFDANNTLEPAELMLEAIRHAMHDAGISENDITKQVDSISVVPPWTWPYDDLPALLAENLGCSPAYKFVGAHGGNQPGRLCDEAARRISVGKARVAIITGGEALASLAACEKAGQIPPKGWKIPSPDAKGLVRGNLGVSGSGFRHSIGLPIQVYPLYENGFRSYRGQSFLQNTEESAALYASFDKIACQHPYSWRFGKSPRNTDAIATVNKSNRMICTPYPLLMNAFNTVNLAAACILTSVGQAKALGIPESKWTYVLGGAGTDDAHNFWERPNFYSSGAVSQSIDAALDASGLSKDDIDCFDFYSCFPIVPKLACAHLGLDVVNPQKPISLLGGLTSFGGAGNNYSMHAITEMTRQIRQGVYRAGLVLANGGVLSYQHAVCLASQPRRGRLVYPLRNPLPEQVQGDVAPQVIDQAEGVATVETYTVEFNRDGSPKLGHVVGRLKDGRRFVANHGDDSTLIQLANQRQEPIGRRGVVSVGQDGRNLFCFQSGAKF